MNRYFRLVFTLTIAFTLICCGGKKVKPFPDDVLTNEESMALDSSHDLSAAKFYKLEESLEDIQEQIARLRVRVMEYENESSGTNYIEQLKKLIDDYPATLATHQIILKNGSVIEGTIENDLVKNIIVKTNVGKLTINKNEIENIEDIEDLILLMPDIIFIGHGQEEIFDNYHLFTGKILNQGSRRGDFVRIIYQLWGEDTQIIMSDSTFVTGTQVMYKSGIVTDTALEPNQSANFSLQVPIDRKIPISYVTREIRWSLYD